MIPSTMPMILSTFMICTSNGTNPLNSGLRSANQFVLVASDSARRFQKHCAAWALIAHTRQQRSRIAGSCGSGPTSGSPL